MTIVRDRNNEAPPTRLNPADLNPMAGRVRSHADTCPFDPVSTPRGFRGIVDGRRPVQPPRMIIMHIAVCRRRCTTEFNYRSDVWLACFLWNLNFCPERREWVVWMCRFGLGD